MSFFGQVCPLGTKGPYQYVLMLSRYQGKWLLSRHRSRSTWETQGGHVEAGETPEEAARRELYETYLALERQYQYAPKPQEDEEDQV